MLSFWVQLFLSSSLIVYWIGGVIWLGEVTMRYGREEGRLFDTATRWSCSVIYNGNRKELAESNTGLHQPHIYRRLHTDWTYRLFFCHMNSCTSPVRIKASVWSYQAYHMKKMNTEDASANLWNSFCSLVESHEVKWPLLKPWLVAQTISKMRVDVFQTNVIV